MSWAAGYFSLTNKKDGKFVAETIRTFDLSPPGGDIYNYKEKVIEYRHGHVFGKYIDNAVPRIRCQTWPGFDLLTVGFFINDDAACFDCVIPEKLIRNQDAAGIAGHLERSEGFFTSILIAHTCGTIHIVNDHFGNSRLYWKKHNDTIFFANNLALLFKLSGTNPKPDPLGWLQMFCYGHTLDARTNCKDVYRLCPGSHVVIDREGIRHHQYWKLDYDVRYDMNPEEHAKSVFEAICDGAKRQSNFGKKGILSLSGGMDSRLVAASIPRARDYQAVTFINSVSQENTPEVECAHLVAQKLGMKHHIIPIPQAYMSDIGDWLGYACGSMQPLHHCIKAVALQRESCKLSSFSMSGTVGDVLAGSYINSRHQLNPDLTESQVRHYCINRKRHSRKVLLQVFKQDVLEHYYPLLDNSMFESFERFNGPTDAHRISAWAMAVRQPAFSFSGPGHPCLNGSSPHMDYRYVDLMLQLPAEWLFGKNFYFFMIYHCIPELRDVPYANTGRCLDGVFRDYHQSSFKKFKGYLVSLTPEVIINGKRIYKSRRKHVQEYFEYDLLFKDSRLLSEVLELLGSVGVLSDIFNIEAAQKTLHNFYDGKIDAFNKIDETELIGCLISACYWFKHYGNVRVRF